MIVYLCVYMTYIKACYMMSITDRTISHPVGDRGVEHDEKDETETKIRNRTSNNEVNVAEDDQFPRRGFLKAAGGTAGAILLGGQSAVARTTDVPVQSGSEDVPVIQSTPENVDWGGFDPGREPVLAVESGDAVTIETVTIPRANHPDFLVDNGVSRSDVLDDEVTVWREVENEGPGPHVVTGPIYIEDAEPGDILEVHVRDIEYRAPYGINLFVPGGGALPEEFAWSETHVIPMDLENELALFTEDVAIDDSALLSEDIEVPLDPFFGIMAVSPTPTAGRTSTGPPSYFGGNMDNPQLGVGSTVYFPVSAEGALFWAGDGHAVQGNGEVCITAVESSLTGTFEFTLHKDTPRLDWPVGETEDHYIPMGFNEDLDEAMKHAVREAISLLVHQQGLSPADAYRLCSIAVDFNIAEVVDGTEIVQGLIPKSIFSNGGPITPDGLAEEF